MDTKKDHLTIQEIISKLPDKKAILDMYMYDKKLVYKIIRYLYLYCNNIQIKKPKLIDLYLFTPLPAALKYQCHNNDYSYSNNRYSLQGKPGSRILTSNVSLPHPTHSPIPFSFLYKYDGQQMIVNSNVYYFEIYINKIPFRNPWSSQTISIGFGTTNVNIFNNHVGWSKTCIGYHSDDGIIYYNGSQKFKCQPFTYDDFIGAGIIYTGLYTYKIFFTRNGTLLPYYVNLETKDKLVPMIGIDHSASVMVNFGNVDFVYNFMEHAEPIVISTKNNFINNHYILNDYEYNCNLIKFYGHIKNNDTYICIDNGSDDEIQTDTDSYSEIDSDEEMLVGSIDTNNFTSQDQLTQPLLSGHHYIDIVNELSNNVMQS